MPMHVPQGGAQLLPHALGREVVEGHFTDEWERGAVLYVVAVAHGGIHAFLHKEHCHGYHKPHEHCYKQHHARVGRRGQVAAVGHVDNLCVERGVGLVDFVLLFLLQQIEVEAFLHLLLALHRHEMLGLLRVGGEFAACLSVVALQGLQLNVYGLDLVGDGGENIPPHVFQLCLLLDDERILRRRAVEVALELHEHRVVEVDLRFRHHVVDARVGGQELASRRLVAEDAEDIFRHRLLVG